MELHEVEERFRLLMESVKDYAIFMLDMQGRVTCWNAGAEQLLGYQEADKQRARDVGFDHHLVKPVDSTRLDSLLALLVEQERAT